jgi:hypothetical protein
MSFLASNSRPKPKSATLTLQRSSRRTSVVAITSYCQYITGARRTLELKIAVNNTLGVYVAHSEAELAEEPAGLGFGEATVLDEVVEEFSTGT